jgi:hypothetical protein
MTIWGDAKTGLPIVVEMTLALLPDAKITLTDFEFDVKLDEALFTTEPPAGYSLQQLNVATPAERDLIAALKLLSADNAGKFPDTLDHAAIVRFLVNRAHKNAGGPNEAWKQEVMNLSLSLSKGLTFAVNLPAESNARYAGKGVEFNDATIAVFWYKPAGAANYRVIYGDLSLRDLTAAPASQRGVPVKLGNPVQDWTREIMNKKPSPVAPALPLKVEPVPPPKELPPEAPLAPGNQGRLAIPGDQSALLKNDCWCRLNQCA